MIDIGIAAFLLCVCWFSLAPVFRQVKREHKQKGVSAALQHNIETAHAMEALLKLGALLPMSDLLCAIILGRKLRCLTALKQSNIPGVIIAWEDARRRYHDHRGLITTPAPQLFLPTNDVRRKKMQTACRQILHFLRKELMANTPHPEWVRVEIQRLTEVDIELSVDADLHQARHAITIGREGSARQFLTNARDTLMQHPHAAELKGLREDVISMLNRYQIAHQIPNVTLTTNQNPPEGDGLDRMFGEKQGW